MKYVGSKNLIARDILGVMLPYRKPGQYWVEPFVGGANIIDKVKDGPKIGADANKYLIALLKRMQQPGFEAPIINEMQYKQIKENPQIYEDWLVAYCGFCLSRNGVWFSQYAGLYKKRNSTIEAKRNLEAQCHKIRDVFFVCSDYRCLDIPDKSIVYCDPPYESTLQPYSKRKFDSVAFWSWCRIMATRHTLFISEFNAPDDFKCIWKKVISKGFSKKINSFESRGKAKLERLFVFGG